MDPPVRRAAEPTSGPSRACWAFIALGVLLGAAFSVTDGGVQGVLYAAVGGACVVAILVGVRLFRPERPGPWLLLAASQAAFVLGDGLYALADAHLTGTPPFPGPSDVLYLAGYPFLVAALALLQGAHARERGTVVESAVIAVALSLVGWVLLVAPAWAGTEGDVAARLVSAAYPAMDVLLAAMVLRTLLLVRWRSPALRLVLWSVLVMGASDVVYAVTAASGDYRVGGVEDMGWLISYVLLGAAALHPSMSAVARPATRDVVPPAGRVGLLASGLLVAPALVVWQEHQGGSSHAVVVAGWVVLTVLVVVRAGALFGELSHAATYDELTGLLSRRALLAHLAQALERVERGTDPGVVVAFFGMDGYKLVNDGLGHDVGDQLLAQVAARLQDACGRTERVGRLGGDEFVIVATGADGDDAVPALVGRLGHVLDEPFVVAGETFYLRATAGAVRAGPGRHEVSELLRAADGAMDGARRGSAAPRPSGAATDGAALDHLRIRSSLRQAVANGELRLHYQPEVEIATGRLFAYEALMRWRHPERGLLGPAAFIDAAEATGEIRSMGGWALGEATRQLRRWSDGAHGGGAGVLPTADGPRMAVNVSVHQLADRSLPDVVAEALERSGLAPTSLTVEITESALLADVAAGVHATRTLKDMGVAIAIDDFGTGYSSLSQLRRFPIDVLKIDRTFVRGLATVAEDRAVVAAVVTLAHALGVRAVAEGVEEVEQLTVLGELGCDVAQGFLLARPLAPEVLEGELPSLRARWEQLCGATVPASGVAGVRRLVVGSRTSSR